MKDFLKEYIFEILSGIVLFFAFVLVFLRVYLYPLQEYTKTIESLNLKQQTTLMKLSAKVYEMNKKNEDINEIESVDFDVVPSLLIRINDTCKNSNVVILSLSPYADDQFKFKLNFEANYFDFLSVLAEFEKLDIMINNIEVKPKNKNTKELIHFISLDISAINGGKKISQKAVEFLDTELAKKEKRDPFQRFVRVGKVVHRLINLTWVHKLSGIGKIKGRYVATIDHKLYFANDVFKNLIVRNITSSSVMLEGNGENGVINYILKFRINDKKVSNE